MHPVFIPAPASKSLSHRTLMAAALAQGTSYLTQVLESDDTARTRDIFTALGAEFTRTGDGAYTVRGIGGVVQSQDKVVPLDCFVGESGTTCRIVTAILAAGQGRFRIHGAGRMHDRPLGDLATALTALGASITFEGKPNCPPLVIDAHGLDSSSLPGGMVDLGSDESSQYLSGLLLAAPLGKGLTVRLGGSKVVSWPYVSLTLETLERFGIEFTVETLREDPVSTAPAAGMESATQANAEWQVVDWRTLTEAVPGKLRFCVSPGTYRAGSYAVEGDWSGASYFLAAGAIGPKPVCVQGLDQRSMQGDAALLDILKKMGARIQQDDAGITVFPSLLRGVEVDMGHCPDLVPTVAALAAHAQGATIVTNVAHLKIKESDRLHAPAQELAKVGCVVMVTDSGLIIAPPPKGLRAPAEGTVFSSHNDHRMAMSLSLLGLPGISAPQGKNGESGGGFTVPLDDPACVAKSFPHFWELWAKVTA